MMHHPLFPQGYFAGSNLHNAAELHLLFLSCEKIKGIFAGHDHLFNCYIRDGITYITSAGGGEPLYHGIGGDFYHFLKVSIYDKQQRINLKAIDVFNEIMEDFDL
jgi:hypothetical protein